MENYQRIRIFIIYKIYSMLQASKKGLHPKWVGEMGRSEGIYFPAN